MFRVISKRNVPNIVFPTTATTRYHFVVAPTNQNHLTCTGLNSWNKNGGDSLVSLLLSSSSSNGFHHHKRFISSNSGSSHNSLLFTRRNCRKNFTVDQQREGEEENEKNRRNYSSSSSPPQYDGDELHRNEYERNWKDRPGGKKVRLRAPNAAEVLVILNCLLFLMMGDSAELKQSLSTSIRALAEGKLFTLLTSMFTHVNFVHLLANCVALWSFRTLVPVIGNRRFLTVYFVSGLVGTVAFLTQYGVQYINSTGLMERAINFNKSCCGASGAIFGLFSFLAHLAPQSKIGVMFVIPLPAIRALQLITLFEVVRFLFDISPEISATGHLGGIVAGRLLYKAMARRIRI